MAEYAAHPDHALAALLRAGDRAAFSEVYGRYQHRLLTHAYQRLRDRQEVSDLIQDVFVALWQRREELVLTTSLAGYLYTAVNNRILDVGARQRVSARYVASFRAFLEEYENNADFLVREQQLSQLIEQEIARLPAKMREVFELSRREGHSHKEIAAQLGLSEMTVKRQINNALRMLRVKFGGLLFLGLVLGVPPRHIAPADQPALRAWLRGRLVGLSPHPLAPSPPGEGELVLAIELVS